MNAIVRVGVVAFLALLSSCTPVNGSFNTRTITDQTGMKVSATTHDASVRMHMTYTGYVWNQKRQAFELKSMDCSDAPPDALVVLAGSGSASVGAEKKKADPSLTFALGYALSSSGMQLQRAANQRRTDSIHEANCSMYVAGAISGREYLAQEIMNSKVALVMAGEEAIVSLLAPPPPAMTISVNAPASSASTPAPAGLSSISTTNGTQGVSTNQSEPASAGTAAAPASASSVDGWQANSEPANQKVASCPGKTAAQKKACKSSTNSGAAPSKGTASQPTRAGASAGGAGAGTQNSNVTVTPTQDRQVLIEAIDVIKELTERGLDAYPNLACDLDSSHGQMSVDSWDIECNGGAARAAVVPNGKPPSSATLAAFAGMRLYTQVQSTLQVTPGTVLVQRLGNIFGQYMKVYGVEVDRMNLPSVEIRYYGRTAADDHNDPDYKAAAELSNQLINVFSPNKINLANWTCCVDKKPSSGLLELWIPARITINPKAKVPAESAMARSATVAGIVHQLKSAAGH